MTELTSITPVERSIEIKHPESGEAVGLRVTLMSSDDDRMRKAIRRVTDKALQLQRRNKSFNAAEVEENQISLLAQAITDWKWHSELKFRGETPELSIKAATEVLTALPWLRSQIDEEMGDVKSFFQK